MRNASIKLYSLAVPLFTLPMLGFGFDQIIPYLKGPEFRVVLAELLTQMVTGVVDAFILTGIGQLFGTA